MWCLTYMGSSRFAETLPQKSVIETLASLCRLCLDSCTGEGKCISPTPQREREKREGEGGEEGGGGGRLRLRES